MNTTTNNMEVINTVNNFFINGHKANPNQEVDHNLMEIMTDLFTEYNNFPNAFQVTFINYTWGTDSNQVQHTSICIETNIIKAGLLHNPIMNPKDPIQVSNFLNNLIDWDAFINQDEGFYDVTYTAGFNSNGTLNIYIHYTI